MEVAEVPPAVTTVTSTLPVPAGLVTTMLVALSLLILASVLPKYTAVAPLRFLPVIVTFVPPLAEPEVGLIFVTTGAAT